MERYALVMHGAQAEAGVVVHVQRAEHCRERIAGALFEGGNVVLVCYAIFRIVEGAGIFCPGQF